MHILLDYLNLSLIRFRSISRPLPTSEKSPHPHPHPHPCIIPATLNLTKKSELGYEKDIIRIDPIRFHLSMGAFATLDQHGLASPNELGVGRPAPTAATQLVCTPVPIQPGPGELVFATQYSAGLKRQPPPTTEHRMCLRAVVLGLAQREGRTA
jgi:hypothetical protein